MMETKQGTIIVLRLAVWCLVCMSPAGGPCAWAQPAPEPSDAAPAKLGNGSADANWRWQRGDSSVALLAGENVVWQFNYGTDYGKPYFHPLSTVEGNVLTSNAPDDHPWHHGLWFSWKYIDGVNYWENNRELGRPDGRTRWSNIKIDTRDEGSARITMSLEYADDTDGVVLKERRSLNIASPDSQGEYTVDWASDFTAEKAAVLDRSPFTAESAGGYAGLSVRFSETMDDRQVFSPGEQLNFNRGHRYRGHHAAIDYSGSVEGQPVGLAFLDHPDNVRHPTGWYLLGHPVIGYMNAAVLHDGPLELDAGDQLQLRYRLIVHPDRWSPEQLQQAYRDYAGGTRSTPSTKGKR